ncbi:MAG: hypothetical protein QXW35_05055 [Candidatus Aenigmatarchaeota archaeon]
MKTKIFNLKKFQKLLNIKVTYAYVEMKRKDEHPLDITIDKRKIKIAVNDGRVVFITDIEYDLKYLDVENAFLKALLYSKDPDWKVDSVELYHSFKFRNVRYVLPVWSEDYLFVQMRLNDCLKELNKTKYALKAILKNSDYSNYDEKTLYQLISKEYPYLSFEEQMDIVHYMLEMIQPSNVMEVL